MPQKIKNSRFYFEWRGHPISDMSALRTTALSLLPLKPMIYLAGDSSLDNKYWVSSYGSTDEESPSVDIPEIYKAAFDSPRPKLDIAFWLNHGLGDRATTLNLAVEESTLRERSTELLDHDKFIRDNIGSDDILVISVGGNDIALKPTYTTMYHMLQLSWLTPRFLLQRGWFLGHFTNMFKSQVEAYVSRLVEKQKPRAVIVCMIYYPLEASALKQKSWADFPLKIMGYNRYPGQLQTAISQMYELATKKIRVQGVDILPCALFESLDGKNKIDYTSRVEPSAEGGRKIALQVGDLIKPLLTTKEREY